MGVGLKNGGRWETGPINGSLRPMSHIAHHRLANNSNNNVLFDVVPNTKLFVALHSILQINNSLELLNKQINKLTKILLIKHILK